MALKVVDADDETTVPRPSVLPAEYVVALTGAVVALPAGYLTTK